jgi:hypothetical protein
MLIQRKAKISITVGLLAAVVSFLVYRVGAGKNRLIRTEPLKGIAVSDPTSKKTDHGVADFKWFDSLDFDAVRTGKFVKLRHKGDAMPNEPAYFEYGFLTSHSGEPITALSTRLTPLRSGPKFENVVDVIPVDFQQFARQQLVQLGLRKPFNNEQKIENGSGCFVMARACEARGLHSLSKAYLATISPNSSWNYGGQMVPESDIKEQIASTQYSLFVFQFIDPDVNWSVQLAQAERLNRFFSDSDEGPQIKEAVSTLRSMVDGLASKSDQTDDIDRLIRQLPNENVRQGMHPGAPMVFFGFEEESKSPAHQLARIGIRAVPKLIGALSDRRFTHSGGGDHGVVYALRVGDLAIQILEKIAAKPIGEHAIPLSEDSIPGLKKDAQAWFSNFRQGGELADLTRKVEENGSQEAASAIVDRYPKDAARVLGGILSHSELRGIPRQVVIWQLARTNDPAVVNFLKTESEKGPELRARVIADEQLSRLEPAYASKAFISEWQKFTDPFPGTIDHWNIPETFLREDFIEPIVQSKDAAALRQLTEGLATRPLQFRSGLVEALLTAGMFHSLNFKDMGLESVLVSELDDNWRGTGLNSNKMILVAPEIGDLAAYALSEFDSEKYPFKKLRFRSQMRQQRYAFKNHWRLSNGQEPLPIYKAESLPAPPSSTGFVKAVFGNGGAVKTNPVKEIMREWSIARFSWTDFIAFYHQAAALPFPKNCFVRLIVSRDAPGSSLVVRLDNGVKLPSQGGGGPIYSWNVVEDSESVGGISGGGDISSNDQKRSIEHCLNLPVPKSFDIELTVWPKS